VLLGAVRLSLDLQLSRERLVTAREEERRRLRRDLHDGLGPALAAVGLKLGSAAARIHDPDTRALVEEARLETRSAIADIRRLVDDLRPPALDEVGLMGALRQQAQRFSRPAGADGPALVVTLDGPEAAPPLPAAVEVAALRITTEALTNVVKHARATRAVVTVELDGGLLLSVQDNGCGPVGSGPRGVGWDSMRERAAELGGSCTVAARPEGGTVVRAVLPFHGAATEPVPVGERP
jgi:signal transduction histidine kinase